MTPKAVRNDKPVAELRSTSVVDVGGAQIKVRDAGSGSVLSVAVPSHVDLASIKQGDQVLVHFDGGKANLVAAYGAVSSGGVPMQSGYYLGALDAPAGARSVRGGRGIEVQYMPDGSSIINLRSPLDLSDISLTGIPAIEFAGGVTLSGTANDRNLYLAQGSLASAVQTNSQGWTLNSDGGWHFLRRDGFGPGPDFTQKQLYWYTTGGTPLVRLEDEAVFLGLEGDSNQITITPRQGLRISGESIEAETLDATAIGPKLTAYLASILPTHPISISVPAATPSPWSTGIADPADPTAVQLANGIELWLRAGGYGNLPQDTRIFHLGPDGFAYGMPGKQVLMDLNGNVAIPANLLVSGTVTVGTRIDIGQGTWGVNFTGTSISSNWGLVGLSTGDTWNWTNGQGTYQVWWDRTDGNLKAALGDIWFGAQGMTIYEESQVQAQDRRRIRWRGKSNQLLNMELGTRGLGVGTWSVYRPDGFTSAQYINMVEGYGMELYSGDAYIGYTVADGGQHRWRIGVKQIAYFDVAGAHFQPPFELGPWMFHTGGELSYNYASPKARLDIRHDGPQLALRLDDAKYTNWRVESGRTVWSTIGDMVLNPVSRVVKPAQTYAINLGAADAKWLTIHAAELRIDNLVAQNVVSTIGGRVLIAPTTKLKFDVQATDTVIYTEHNDLVPNDILRLEARGNVEFMAVTSTFTASSGGYYRYTVTRNLDGSGANLWLAGDAVVNTRQAGYGFIDQYAGYGLKSNNEIGPAIVFNMRQSATYNDWASHTALGRLDGLYDYASGGNTWGSVFGTMAGPNITIDTVNGIRIRYGSLNKITLDTVGNAIFTGTVSSAAGNIGGWSITSSTLTGANIILGSAGYAQAGSGNNIVRMDSTDPVYRFWIGHATASQAAFRVTTTGYVTASSGLIGGWLLGPQNFNSNNGNTGMSAAGTYAFWAGGTSTFHVKHNGYLFAINGSIGGFTISQWNIVGGQLNIDSANARIWFGNSYITGGQTGYIYVSGNIESNGIVNVNQVISDTLYVASTSQLQGNTSVAGSNSNLGFYGSSGAPKQTVTGSRDGNAALANLLTALASLNLITNSTIS